MRIFFLLLCPLFLFSQNTDPSTARLESAKKQLQLNADARFANLPVTNIGPTVFSGRVTSIRVNPENPIEFFVGYATGGLWYTNNNGTSFTPLFSHEYSHTIGDFDVNWDSGEIFLGSGEVNSSRSSYAGVGMFYSSDMGKNWKWIGLEDSHHIGRVIIDKEDQSTVYVAVLGHLYTPNEQRGLYKTTDKGKSWEQVLSINENTGIVELLQNPRDPNQLYACAWERSRKAWNFVEGGPNSAIYFSNDKGMNWERVTTSESGFPSHDLVGRIGMDISFDDGEPVLYALVDNYKRRNETKEEESGLTSEDFIDMTKSEFLALPKEDIATFLKENRFDKKYTAEYVIEQVEQDKIKVSDLHYYLYDSNQMLFDTPVIGAQVYRSVDNGKTWNKTHSQHIDGLYNSYGYYFGLIKAAPMDPNQIYIAGVPILYSVDGGETFVNVNGDNVHVDHHALWINPNNSNHIILGNDGGINISYDSGKSYIKCNSPSVGQFYTVNVDYNEPYNVYGGTQDNGVWKGPSNYRASNRWHNTGKYPYEYLQGGDGMEVQIDSRNSDVLYTGLQFGNYYRFDLEKEDKKYITPRHELGESPYRWNWQTPILLSSHNQDIFYMGNQYLMRSFNQGDDFKKISNDLTKGGKKGDVAFGTLTTISESPFQFGLIYAGSDDGLIYRTDDGGVHWTEITTGLPEGKWVSKVFASNHDIDRVYASLNGYRNDDFQPYLFMSNNRGKDWEPIGNQLPLEPINVIIEDPSDPNILYVGTDNGTYISMDQGKSFEIISNQVPRVPVHDLVIQKEANDLIIGTHGRSFYKVDLNPIYKINNAPEAEILVYADTLEYRRSDKWGTKKLDGTVRVPEDSIMVYLSKASDLSATLQSSESIELNQNTYAFEKGFQKIPISFVIDEKQIRKFTKSHDVDTDISSEDGETYLHAGQYSFDIELNGNSKKVILVVK